MKAYAQCGAIAAVCLTLACAGEGATTTGGLAASRSLTSDPCVATPFGNRPLSTVHHLATGNAIGVTDGRVQERTVQGELVADYGSPADIAATVAAAACARPHSLFAAQASDGTRPTYGSGWIADARWDRPTGQAITRDSGTWIVPPSPSTSNGQLVFIFNGVQGFTATDSAIIQPVLQWGATSFNGGGAYYVMDCWFLLNSGTWYGSPVEVYPGDSVYASVDSFPTSPYKYSCTFKAPPRGEQWTGVYGAIPELYEAVETIEAYGITGCSDYPNTTLTAMTNINILTHAGTPTLSWTAYSPYSECGQKASVVSNADPGGEVDLYFRYPPPTVGISGTTEIDTKGTYTWSASVSGGDGSYTYQWVLREDGGSDTNEGTSSTQARTVDSGDANFWWILSVTSAGLTTKDSLYIYNCIGNPGCSIQ